MSLGQFITVEGIDGAGKSSHLEGITHYLRARGLRVVETREPGGTPLGETLRSIILHENMSTMAELLMVFAARAEHLEQLIKPALLRGDWVVCDRFTDSTRAYQGGGRGMDHSIIEQLAMITHAQCNPNLTLIFDVDLNVALARVERRAEHSAVLLDKFETAPQSFASNVQATYRRIAAEQPERCVLINGGQSIEAVRADVVAALHRLLAKHV